MPKNKIKKEVKNMITIKNYNSNRELSNYKTGDVYTFYIHNPMKRLAKVKEDDFQTYVEKLNNIIDTHEDIIMNNVPYLNFTRSIGVVIDFHKLSCFNCNSKSAFSPDDLIVMSSISVNGYTEVTVSTIKISLHHAMTVFPAHQCNTARHSVMIVFNISRGFGLTNNGRNIRVIHRFIIQQQFPLWQNTSSL